MKLAEDDPNATILTGGHRLTDNGRDKGFFFEPTIIELNDNSHQLAQEEILDQLLLLRNLKTNKRLFKLPMILNMD